jgi:TctA family transporter
MVDAYIQAVVALLQPTTALAMLAGMIVGIVIGILPAIGGMVGCSLFLPFLWKMDPLIAMAIYRGQTRMRLPSWTGSP